MKVTGVEPIAVAYPEPNDNGSTRHLLLVRVTGDDGQAGWGEAVTMWPEATLATAQLVTGLAPLVTGTDPADRDATHAALAGHTWWYGNGGLASFAIAAIDIALWDLHGKATGRSVLDMLGGPAHAALPVLVSCHAMDADLTAMAATMAAWVREHQATGIKVGFGKKGTAGLGTDPARDEAFIAALRRELGPAPKIMVDIGAAIRWSLETAAERCRMLEHYGADWIEEPLGADDPEGYQALRGRTSLRIAYGEREWTPRGIERIAATGTVDVVGVDPGRCLGITGWQAAQRHVAAAGAEINAHAWSSGIVTAASLALSLASPNCGQVEVKPLRNPMQHELLAAPVTAQEGRLRPQPGPGLGIQVRQEVIDRYRLRA